MALYQYLKSKPKKVFFKKREGLRRNFSFLFSILGIFLVGNAIVPVLSYQLGYSSRFKRIVSPLIYEGGSVLGTIEATAREEEKDYTLVSSWFTEKINEVNSADFEPTFFQISIPKLGIKEAKVQVGGEDLKKSLVHYSNTAFPGQLGNTVIFGHSVLPQFFDPKNYLTIFSTLYKLKEGDEIFAYFDGVTYRYLVEDLYEVAADDLSVLEQRYDDRFLTLITCSPPGTYLRRLIVKARIVEL